MLSNRLILYQLKYKKIGGNSKERGNQLRQLLPLVDPEKKSASSEATPYKANWHGCIA